MASNTYDSIPADRIGVLTEEAPLPSPEVLGDESAASCVWSDILKPIASDPMSPVLRYLGTWACHAATGLELRKTYADGTGVVKTYDGFNRLSTETSARGPVAAYAYETARGLLTGISYSDTTPGIAYSYNHLGALTQVTDAAGTRSLGYNTYGEAETDSLVAGEKTHLITELRDSLGRSVGYTYAKDGAVQQTVGTSYGTDGRITGAGFLHGGELKEFTYTYVTGSHLLQGLAMPNNMALSLSYETQRDLMTGMVYTRGTTTVVQRGYSYDALGRPLTRAQSRQGGTRNDSFTHNDRSELTSATLGTDAYAYAYDNIGNRLTAQEAAEETTDYTANNLNQYTAIQEGTAEAFAPTYDADGNQTLVKTSTGIWSVTYNAANRPVVFANEATGTVVECSYDSSGRRATKKVTVNGTVTLHQRYIYRGYLQIAALDLTRTAHPCLWLITWEPTQPIATRPLAIQKDGTWYTYGFDLTKNVMEVFTTTGYIGTAYTYTPYGEVSASGNITQPIQWSSEYHDAELDLVYYNYRHYNPADGRWTGRDLSFSKHKYLSPAVLQRTDFLGLIEMSKPTYKEVDSLMTLKGKEKLLFGGVSIRVELEATKEERGKEYCVIVKIVKFWIHTEVLKRNSLQYDFDENKPSSIDQKFIWRLRRTRDAFEIMGEENFWILYNSPFKQVSYEGVKVHENEHARIMLSYSSKIKDLLGSKTIVQCYQDCASRDRIYKGVMDKKCRYPRGSELSKRVRDEVYALFPPEKTMEALATRAEYQYYINTLLKD